MDKIGYTPKRIVVKYGGNSLADGDRVQMAARAVARETNKGHKIAVVVSAMGKTTDQLLQVARSVSGGNMEGKELDDVLAMGERISVRVFAVALKSNDVETRYFDPSDSDWPIITDDAFSNANPILEECEKRIQQQVLPVFERGAVPVIAGFVGRTVDGKITTLGRGGSDTTAFILAKALGADEVILVTDVDGIMTADPKVVESPRKIREIDVNTLVGLADSGTKFIHRKALKYKDPSINVRIIAYHHGDLSQEGTVVTGGLKTELDADLASVASVASITVVGRGLSRNPNIIGELMEHVKRRSSLLGFSMDYNSTVLFVPEDSNLKELLSEIHNIVIRNEGAVAMSLRQNLAFLRISGVGLEENPGLIGKISEPLRARGINIFGILTNTSSILLFVNWESRDKALSLIRSSLGLKGRCD